jgi:hypothetical protein
MKSGIDLSDREVDLDPRKEHPMNRYNRQYLRERFLAVQQSQLAEDAKLDDPRVAYQALLDELNAPLDVQRDEPRERAA